jgi:hypothetical protein
MKNWLENNTKTAIALGVFAALTILGIILSQSGVL